MLLLLTIKNQEVASEKLFNSLKFYDEELLHCGLEKTFSLKIKQVSSQTH